MYAVVLGVGVVCAVAIALVYQITLPIIQRNALEFRNRAILKVLPETKSIVPFRWTKEGEFQQVSAESSGEDLVFACFDAAGNLAGFAIEAEAMGYQDVVRVLYGYSQEKKAIIGLQVLQSRETPGLGDRIAYDPDFLGNFEALDVRLEETLTGLAHPIEFVKSGKKTQTWQIDGISGATVTSRATATMLRESAETWIPRIEARLVDFVQSAGEE